MHDIVNIIKTLPQPTNFNTNKYMNPLIQDQTSSLAKNIKILKENKVYRFTDLVLQRGIRWREDRETIMTDKQYSNTILYDYLSSLGSLTKNEKPNLRYLHECIIKHSINNNLKLPKKDFLTIPLRLGDILDIPGRYKKSINYYSNIYEKILQSRLKEPKGIYIVSAMHFGANDKNGMYFFTEEAKNKSLALFSNIVDQLRSLECPIEVISHDDIDVDICFIARSEYIFPSESKMTQLIRDAQMATMKPIIKGGVLIKNNFKPDATEQRV